MREERRRYGTIAADAAIGGATSAVGTAGLLGVAGLALKRKTPELAGMLRTAAKQHIKVFNPWHTVPMMRSLPEASRLFGKQLRTVKEAENIATTKVVPSVEHIQEAIRRTGVHPTKDIEDIAKFKQRWGRTPGDTMEKSVGLLSGLAATGVGVAGGAALSKGWKKEKQLSALLDDIIELKTLYQPRKEDEPPERLPRFTEGTPIDYTVQQHVARRAGFHRDIRIGTPRHGLLSWATRKELPAEGGKIAIHPQSVHAHSYLGWEGSIPSGYGAGEVKTEHLGKALVTHSSPTEIHATLADQKEHHRLAFIKTARGWLMTRGKTPSPPPEAAKPKYKSVAPEKAHEHLSQIEPGTIVQPKVDGALVYVKTEGGRPEIFSHRISKTTGKHPIHTERVFGGRPTVDIPREHQRTLIAELYGEKGGKAIEPQELGGILNTHIGESLQKQRARGIRLKLMPFDIVNGKKKSYPERVAQIQETLRHLPKDQFHMPEMATTPEQAKGLFERIRRGKHPLTTEGVVVHPPHGRMVKIKNVEEANVKITGTFPGSGKFAGSHGGITYEGGRVGTGFSDETRRQLHEYIGRTARIRHQGKYKSGAYRAPSFIAVEENR